MVAIISPAKNMKIEENGTAPMSVPAFLLEAQAVCGELQNYYPPDLQVLMKISESLAEDSFDRNQTVRFDKNGTSAVETYHGIQYQYMDARTFSPEAKAFAQAHVRILSGFYGLLRPYDSIYEYRLEMLTKLSVGGSKNLYDFWGQKLYDALERELCGEPVILNLASKEYARAVCRFVKAPVNFVTCTFRTFSKGKHRVLATAAKMARGSMVRYLAMNQIDSIEGVKNFAWDGYRYEESLSGPKELVFLQR